MTLITEKDNCKLINHQRLLLSYQDDSGNVAQYQLKDLLFKNFRRKQKLPQKEAKPESNLKARIESFLSFCRNEKLFPLTDDDVKDQLKADNLKLLNDFYDNSNDTGILRGENNLEIGKLAEINDAIYLIPPRCKFFNNKVEMIKSLLPPSDDNKFDFIVVDPPWRNRYIKRVKKNAGPKQGYSMMNDDEISGIPLSEYLKKSSIVVIWCTNSDSHIKAIKEKFLVEWNLTLVSMWQWIKVDADGELFCSLDGGKKPFEQIFIATHRDNGDKLETLRGDYLIFSQSSSIHSHKPPLLGERD